MRTLLPELVLTALVLSSLPATAQPTPGDLYFPADNDSWETVAPFEVGWQHDRLERLLDWAGEQGSSDIVIVLAGRILAERHYGIAEPEPRYARMRVGETKDGRPIEDVASVQKSVLVFLAGVARGQGLLDFEDPVSKYLGVGWSKATPQQESAITVHHIMSMTSGLSTGREYEVEAGSRWQYNTNVYSRLVPVLEGVFDGPVDEFTKQKLTHPIGMHDSTWKERPWAGGGADANRIGFATSARDLARFGILMLAQGRWDGEDLLGDPAFIEEVFSPSQKHNRSYGLLWWINGQDSSLGFDGTRRNGSFMPRAPDDLIAGLGALGRKLYVVPSLGLVATRLGDNPGRDFDGEFWRLLLEAAPPGARPPRLAPSP